ncbi:MAG: aminotransferase class V-fold PLP-dependent enzyme, partial [Bacteroidota bacterium]
MAIYLDHAATTPLAEPVRNAMISAMMDVHGNPSSIHAAGRKARSAVEDARRRVAGHLRASQGEIFFTSSATEANNTAIFCAARDLGIQAIITSPTEHPCVLNTTRYVSEHFQIPAVMLDVQEDGRPDLNHLAT